MSQSMFEDCVLGSCLIDHHAMGWAHRSIEPEHFTSKANRQIFEIMNSLYTTGRPVDVVTVAGEMGPTLKKAIDLKKLTQAIENTPSASTIEHYADLMRKGSIAFRLDKLYAKLRDDPGDEDAQKDAKRLWDDFGGRIGSAKTMQEAIAGYRRTLDDRKNSRDFHINTGFSKLDELTGGFYGGYMVALGARTSVGKTTAFLHLAYRFLRQKAKTLFISAEMSSDEIIDRLVSMNCEIPAKVLRRGKFEQFDRTRIEDKLTEWTKLPMVWIEGGRMSLTRMRAAIQTYRPSVVFVDFIQRFTPSNPNIQRAAYFSDLANEMKAIAMEQRLVCFAASQLGRAVEFDKNKKPELHHFKESGGIEEASDICIGIHPLPEEETDDFRQMDWIVLKHRHGPVGTVRFMFKKAFTQFFEKEEYDEQVAGIRDRKTEAAGEEAVPY